MDILIKNCNLISMDETRKKIEYGIDIAITKNKIENIEKDLKPCQNTKFLDSQ